MVFDDYDSNRFAEYLKKQKEGHENCKLVGFPPELWRDDFVDAKRLQYLEEHDYKITTSYGVSRENHSQFGHKYIVLTKHRDWKAQDRPFWIPIELAEQVIKDLQEALDFHKKNR